MKLADENKMIKIDYYLIDNFSIPHKRKLMIARIIRPLLTEFSNES